MQEALVLKLLEAADQGREENACFVPSQVEMRKAPNLSSKSLNAFRHPHPAPERVFKIST